jgi:hypothetical protein
MWQARAPESPCLPNNLPSNLTFNNNSEQVLIMLQFLV